MRKSLWLKTVFIVAFCFVTLFHGVKPLLALPHIGAAAAVAISAETGEVLYQKNAFQLRAPASTTKILTAILAIESGHLKDVVTVSKNAASVGEASLHLRVSDRLVLRELIYGALIKSGNDACVAIAEHLSPSEEEFVGLMNLKAQILGAYNTCFYNTNGLPHPHHLTTAYDLALITRYALQNPLFREIVATKDYTLKWVKPQRSHYIKNTNRFLWSFSAATGVKTGTTFQAGKCLVASAKYADQQIIVVVLNSYDRYGDAQKLFEYAIKVKEIQSNAKGRCG